jgi:ATP-dependent Clp protease, protease subunit
VDELDVVQKIRLMDSTLEDKTTLVIDFHAKINEETAGRFRKFTSDLIEKHSPEVMYLALSSTGGQNTPAFVFYNYFLSLNLKLLTHCTGVVDSSAVSIFLAGSRRYANPTSRFLIHAPTWTFKAETKLGSAKLKEYVQMMDWDQEAHEAIMRERTTATPEQIAEWHHPGKVLTVDESLEHGFVHEVRHFVRPKRVFRFSD